MYRDGGKKVFRYCVLTPNDGEAWRDLRIEGASDFPLGFLITVEETEKDDLEQCRRILSFGGIRGVKTAEELVGFCGYRPHRLECIRHRGEVGPFFVVRQFQGTGAAQTLMQGVIDEAKKCGVEQLELTVNVGNHAAIAFYERQGFESYGIHPDAVRMEGVSQNELLYRLRI